MEKGFILYSPDEGGNKDGKLFKLHHVQVAHGVDQLNACGQRVQTSCLILQHGPGTRL